MAKTDNRTVPFRHPALFQAGGGPYVATLTADLTIDHVGPRVLVLDPSDGDYVLTIPDATVATNGDQFEVRNSGTGGFSLGIENVAGTRLITLGNGEVAFIRNARGTYVLYHIQGTAGSDSDTLFKTTGGRINASTEDEDDITAAASDGAYVDFAQPVLIPAGMLRFGSRLSVLATVVLADAAAGTATLKTKLTIGPREVWELVVDTEANEEEYGVDLVLPEAGSIVYLSDASGTPAEIADGIADAWNADETCSAYATAESDGVDTVTFTSTTNRRLLLAEDENSGKVTLTNTVAATTLLETTAVDQAEDDFQALDFEINSREAPSSASELVGVGSWITNTGGTLANSVEVLLPADFATDEDLIIRCEALFSASEADTTARLAFITARVE